MLAKVGIKKIYEKAEQEYKDEKVHPTSPWNPTNNLGRSLAGYQRVREEKKAKAEGRIPYTTKEAHAWVFEYIVQHPKCTRYDLLTCMEETHSLDTVVVNSALGSLEQAGLIRERGYQYSYIGPEPGA